MNARRCQGCAAPLPDGDGPDARRCRFCGLTHDPAGRTGERVVQQIHISRSGGRTGRWVVAIVLLALVIALVPAIAGLYAGWRAVNMVSSTAVAPSGSAKGPRMVPADLRTAAAGVHDLDAAPPAGGYAAVDAVAALPWALSIAQGWEKDARLERIDVNRMRPDGTANVADDHEAVIRYRFLSPGREATLAEQSKLTASARGTTSLFVSVERGAPRAQVIESRATRARSEALPPHPAVLSLPRLVARDAVGRLLSGVPFVNGYLIHNSGEGWVWYFSTLAGEPKPRVRAHDGAVWPFRRDR